MGGEGDHVPKRESVARGSNLPRVRAENLTVTLNALRKPQPATRAELATATMSNLVAELGSLGFIREERSPERRVGRRPALLSLDPDGPRPLGLEISRSRVVAVETDLSGAVRRSRSRPAPAEAGAESTLRVVHDLIAELWTDGAAPPAGIGVGIPGPVDSARGRLTEPPNFPGWSGLPLADRLHERWGVPVLVDDDAKTAALGEHWFGAGRTVDSLLYVSVGEGVGAGLIVHDELYRGTHELAGEIGHMTLDLNGPACACGNRGCLETFVSRGAILARAASCDLREEPLAAIDRLAARGDPHARSTKDAAYRYLAAGLVNAVNCYDPDVIVLGGPLVRAWGDLVDALRERVRGRSFGFASRSVDLRESALGETAGAIGAAVLILQHLFREPGTRRSGGTELRASAL